MSTESTKQLVTDRIISLLEAGTVPWRKPWGTSGHLAPQQNLTSGHVYQGINAILTNCMGWDLPYWVTLKQANAAGGSIRAGSKSLPIIFWSRLEGNTPDPTTGKPKAYWMLKSYALFNVAQTWGLDDLVTAKVGDLPSRANFNPIEEAAQILEGMPNRPSIIVDPRACYMPARDVVGMPPAESFESGEAYYATAFHELAHSTGHASRLDRKMGSGTKRGDAYAREELVAELASAILCGEAGISPAVIENSAAYCANWIEYLKGDAGAIVAASGPATRAADYILGRKAESTNAAAS